VGGLTDELQEFLDAHRVGVLATIASDGKPRQSVAYYAREGDRLLISTLSKRLKARDVGRTAWASLSVRGDEQPYPSATFSGRAEILTEDIDRPDHAPHRGYEPPRAMKRSPRSTA
jgi:PPOX class probable F420-dependent enzyme